MIKVEGKHLIPEHMQSAVERYLVNKVHPGGFLANVLANDLVGAYAAADEVNKAWMSRWARWLYYHCPRDAWGSWETVDNWLNSSDEAEEGDK